MSSAGRIAGPMGQMWACPQRQQHPAFDGPYWKTAGRFWTEQWPPAQANALQMYECIVYILMEGWIAQEVFHNSHTAAWLAFGVPLAVRPFGGLCFGCVADALGRRTALMMSVYVMFGATVAQGLTPSAPRFGPAWLVGCRLLQGLATAGQVGSLSVLLAESTPSPVMGHAGALVTATSSFGALLAFTATEALTWLLSPEQMLQGGWRLLFLLVLPPGALVVYAAELTKESPEFERMVATADEVSLCPQGVVFPCCLFQPTVFSHWRVRQCPTA